MDDRSDTFGRYLRAMRLERGVDLETVSRTTRIGKDLLIAIEQENHDQLPAEVFVKGFIRSYARAIGADGEEAIRLYLDSLTWRNRAVSNEAKLLASNTTFWRRLAGAFLCFVALVTITLVATMETSSPPEPQQEKPSQASGGEAVVPSQEEETVVAEIPSPPATAEVPQEPVTELPPAELKKRLRITATEKTWLKINIDKKVSHEYTMSSGESLEFEATSGFNLLIGNATGVTLEVDGQPVAVPGRHGQVVNLDIP